MKIKAIKFKTLYIIRDVRAYLRTWHLAWKLTTNWGCQTSEDREPLINEGGLFYNEMKEIIEIKKGLR